MTDRYIQYGAGLSCPEGWENFDYSPTVRVQKLPLVGRYLVPAGRRFPSAVKIGDIVAGLPVEDDAATAVYASHILEHLSLDDFRKALLNTVRMLKPGGVFRLIVPDLAERARRYVNAVDVGSADANIHFLEACHLGTTDRPKGPVGFARMFFGHSRHLWMWDEASMTHELSAVGFRDIRRCDFGDAADPMFAAVEDSGRFIDDGYTPPIRELAIEARKART